MSAPLLAAVADAAAYAEEHDARFAPLLLALENDEPGAAYAYGRARCEADEITSDRFFMLLDAVRPLLIPVSV